MSKYDSFYWGGLFGDAVRAEYLITQLGGGTGGDHRKPNTHTFQIGVV